eukprot:Clim_evm45s44 gene=Clim_evmTU45s44
MKRIVDGVSRCKQALPSLEQVERTLRTPRPLPGQNVSSLKNAVVAAYADQVPPMSNLLASQLVHDKAITLTDNGGNPIGYGSVRRRLKKGKDPNVNIQINGSVVRPSPLQWSLYNTSKPLTTPPLYDSIATDESQELASELSRKAVFVYKSAGLPTAAISVVDQANLEHMMHHDPAIRASLVPSKSGLTSRLDNSARGWLLFSEEHRDVIENGKANGMVRSRYAVLVSNAARDVYGRRPRFLRSLERVLEDVISGGSVQDDLLTSDNKPVRWERTEYWSVVHGSRRDGLVFDLTVPDSSGPHRVSSSVRFYVDIETTLEALSEAHSSDLKEQVPVFPMEAALARGQRHHIRKVCHGALNLPVVGDDVYKGQLTFRYLPEAEALSRWLSRPPFHMPLAEVKAHAMTEGQDQNIYDAIVLRRVSNTKRRARESRQVFSRQFPQIGYPLQLVGCGLEIGNSGILLFPQAVPIQVF